MRRDVVLLAATVAIALVFSVDGALRLARLEFHVLRFAVWGYPPWTVWAVSLAEIAGAFLLLWPGTFGAGVALLGSVAAGFAGTHIVHGDGAVVAVPLAMLAGVAGLALLARRS